MGDLKADANGRCWYRSGPIAVCVDRDRVIERHIPRDSRIRGDIVLHWSTSWPQNHWSRIWVAWGNAMGKVQRWGVLRSRAPIALLDLVNCNTCIRRQVRILVVAKMLCNNAHLTRDDCGTVSDSWDWKRMRQPQRLQRQLSSRSEIILPSRYPFPDFCTEGVAEFEFNQTGSRYYPYGPSLILCMLCSGVWHFF